MTFQPIGIPAARVVSNLTEKPSAMITLDDRAIAFDGTWPSFDELKAFQPWNKRPKLGATGYEIVRKSYEK